MKGKIVAGQLFFLTAAFCKDIDRLYPKTFVATPYSVLYPSVHLTKRPYHLQIPERNSKCNFLFEFKTY